MLCGSLAGRGVWGRILSFSILVTCFPGFLSFLQSFHFRKRGILRINHLVYVCGLSEYNCTLPLPLSFDLRCKWKIAQSWPTTSLSYFLEMSWLLHLLSTFQIPLRHLLRRMPPGASLTLSWAPPSRFSIKDRQSHWRSREAKPETNSFHAETWILSLQHEGLRCPPVPATHSSCLQHRGARSARWAPFSFALKLTAPSLGHAGPAEQKATCTLTFTTRSGKSKRHRSELDHTASLGRCLDENPGVDLKSSSFQDSGSGNLRPVHLLPWLLSAAFEDWDIRRGGLWQGISRYYGGQRRRSEIWTPETQFCRGSGYQGNSQPSIHFFLPKGDP